MNENDRLRIMSLAGALGISEIPWEELGKISDAGEQNKFLVEFSEKKPDVVDDSLDEKIKHFSTSIRAKKIKQIEESIDRCRNDALRWYQQGDDYLAKAAEYSSTLFSISQPNLEIPKQDGNLKLVDITKDRLIYETIQPVVLQVESFGAFYPVNFGRFKLYFQVFGDGKCILDTLENNLYVDGYHWPFADTTGKICWGNRASLATELLLKRDIQGLLSLSNAWLCNSASVNSNPYVSLDRFLKKAALLSGEGVYPPVCKECGQWSSQCVCVKCDICGEQSCSCDRCETCYSMLNEDGYCPACDYAECDGCGETFLREELDGDSRCNDCSLGDDE